MSDRRVRHRSRGNQPAEKTEGRGFSPAVSRAPSSGVLTPEARCWVFSRDISWYGDHSQRDKTQTSPQRHAPHRPPPSRPLFRRPAKLAETPGRIRLLLLRSRLARANHALRRHRLHSRKHAPGSHRLASRRPRSKKIHALRSIASPRTRRAPRPPLHDHPAKLARTRPHLQRTNRKPKRPRPGHIRFPRLPATPIRRHRDVRRTPPRLVGTGRRRPSPARRTNT